MNDVRPAPEDADHVLLESLESQLHELSEYPLVRSLKAKQHRAHRVAGPKDKGKKLRIVERGIDCFLTWPSPSAQTATTLGPYARWLIAARLLMQQQPSAKKLCEALGVQSYRTERVFGTRSWDDKSLVTRSRYENFSCLDDTGEPVFKEILSWLNEQYSHVRGSRIEREDFLRVPVPIDDEKVRVGTWPIESFEQWLTQGVGIASRASVRELLRTEQATAATDKPDDVTQSIVLALDERKEEQRHKCIVNVHSHAFAGQTTLLARRVCRTLLDKNVSVVYISLGQKATRQMVVQSLYDSFGLNAQRLKALQRRPLDLAVDLEPIRKALTVNRVVVVFDAWDNDVGPLAALQGFICNTNWEEFLRVLAQPHEQTLLESFGRLQPHYKLLVLSVRPATELAPWMRFVESKTITAGLIPREALGDIQPQECLPTIPPAQRCKAHIASNAAGKIAQDRTSLLEILAHRLIAASINGMRADTLERCITEWIRMFFPRWLREGENSEAMDVARWVHDLSKRQSAQLETKIEEDLENLSALQRSLELDHHPRAYDLPPGDAREVLSFASRAARSSFITQWLSQDGLPETEGPLGIDKCGWGHINLVLAEECLRQVTSQFRHLPLEGIESPYAIRRAVQAIYHGLMSLGISSEEFLDDEMKTAGVGVKAAGLYEALLPMDTHKRYIYLYGFVYRELVEGTQWRLGNSLGRPDIWLDLLTVFVVPHLGACMLTAAGSTHTTDLLPSADDMQFIAQPLRSNPELWSDLFLAIGHAGCDLGGKDGRRAVDWALSLLDKTEHIERISILAPLQHSGPHCPVAADALKLRLDWMQVNQDPNTAEQCWEQLRNLRVDCSWFETLRLDVIALLGKMRDNKKGVTTALQAKLEEIRHAIKEKAGSKAELEAVADFLFRLGSIEAIKADGVARNNDSKPTRDSTINALAYACAVYWIADRTRSDAAARSNIGVDWSRAGARYMRSYVSACMRLGYLLSEDAGIKPRHKKFIARLLEHAQNRIGVYTRHHYQLRRERNAMLMLEMSRVRTWLRVDLAYETRDAKKTRATYEGAVAPVKASKAWTKAADKYVRFLDLSQATLTDFCWRLLRETESSLFSMGFQRVLIRRLYMERIETVTALMKLALAYVVAHRTPSQEIVLQVDAHLSLTDPALRILQEICDDSPLWKAITEQQARRLNQTKQAWLTLRTTLV